MWSASAIAAAGGALMYVLVPDSPSMPRAAHIRPQALAVLWTDRKVRASALGYFGHQWELYTFWVLVPAILASRLAGTAVPAASFAVIGAGFFGCAVGGLLARRFGSARVAAAQLAASALCCVLAPLLLDAPLWVFGAWLLAWGVTVVGDSPQFSTLTALNSPRDSVGSVLTFYNCIGFAITIVSIELFTRALQHWPLATVLPWLAIGPALGLRALSPLLGRVRD
jgi:predicted MFS family arabinose efflux permease